MAYRLHAPAPGARDRRSGTLHNVGYYGFSWSSSVSESDAHYLSFGNGEPDPQYSNDRALGFQVRCLLE